MKIFANLLAVLLLFPQIGASQLLKKYTVQDFDKVIISPHIQANLVQGDEESVRVLNAHVPIDKLNVEVEGKTLRIYLDDAKIITKSERVKRHQREQKQAIYHGTMASVNITYKTLNTLSIRGEEDIHCSSRIDQEHFQLRIYGASDVRFKSLNLDDLHVTIYGEGDLKIEDGMVTETNYVAYGESSVKARNLENKHAKIRAYGESDFQISVSDHLKVSAFGEANVVYQGSPSVKKGIVIGEATIRKREYNL